MNSKRLGNLADSDFYRDPLNLEGQDPADLTCQLRRMILIRRAEEIIGEMVASGEVKCPCHLGIGQEAVAVGAAKHLKTTDRIFGNHRFHATFLALGGEPEELFAEVLGKSTGCSGGMGGSMHLVKPEIGLRGTVPIVAATIPIAVGAALACKMENRFNIAVSIFGDGATEEGVFHESLNLASIMNLPVLFICENNLFSSHLHIELRQPYDSIARFADSYRMPSRLVDGNDVIAVSEAVEEMVTRARVGGGPALLEVVTYRWRGHVGPREDTDVGVTRKEGLSEWKKRDPIRRLFQGLEDKSVLEKKDFDNLWHQVEDELRSALSRARKAPFPEESCLLDFVYAPNS